MRADYRDWLLAQAYNAKSISDYIAMTRRIESHYGPLDATIRDGGYDALLDLLTYSTEDERNDRPNPSAFDIRGNIRKNLASYRTVLRAYKRFADAQQAARPHR